MAIVGAGFSIIFLGLLLLIPILIGVYVYRDAGDRGMDGVRWTLIVVLTPGLIGLIIYLLVRGNYSNLKCGRCGAAVKEDYTVCPQCAVPLRAVCSKCGMPVEAEWNVCPRCAAPIEGERNAYIAPVEKRDRILPKILLAVVLIPAILLIGGMVLFSVKTNTGNIASSVTSVIPLNEYEKSYEGSSWIDEIRDGELPIHVLYEKQSGDEEQRLAMAVYSEESFYLVTDIEMKRNKLYMELESLDGALEEDELFGMENEGYLGPDVVYLYDVSMESNKGISDIIFSYEGKKMEIDLQQNNDEPSLFKQFEDEWE